MDEGGERGYTCFNLTEMEEWLMGKKIARILRGEMISSGFYVLLGLCLVLMPAQTVNIICKVVFGIVLAAAGLYHLSIYIRGKDSATILDLFTGVIVLVLGGFLFFNPVIVVKLLPLLLGAFVLVDSIWKLKGSFQLRKRKRTEWQVFLFISLIFIVLGGIMMANPFVKTKTTIFFNGWILMVNGAADFIFYFLLKRGLKTSVEKTEEKNGEDASETEEAVEAAEEIPEWKGDLHRENKTAETAEDERPAEIDRKPVEDEQPAEADGKPAYEGDVPEKEIPEEEILEEWKD